MTIIDTHSHVYLPEFAADQETMIERADKAGIIKILLPAIDATTHDIMRQLSVQRPDYCLSMMGVHPCSVKNDYKNELMVAGDLLRKGKYIGVGETGLDFYWDVTYKEQQYDAFQQQIDWALHYDLPVVIHSRNATAECIEMIEKNQKGALKGVFHCFSGSIDQASKITDLGFYLGIGGVITYKNSGLDKVMEAISLDWVVLETDAPYLAPVPFRGKRNEPSYINYVAKKLADVKSVSIEDVAAITTANAQKLFEL